MKSRNKGITLIGLVITIVIMLILTGITINLLFGDNGLITKTKLAKKAFLGEDAKEEVEDRVNQYIAEKGPEGELNVYDFWYMYNGTLADGETGATKYYDENFVIYLFEEDGAISFTPSVQVYTRGTRYTSAVVIYKGYQMTVDERLTVGKPKALEDLTREEVSKLENESIYTLNPNGWTNEDVTVSFMEKEGSTVYYGTSQDNMPNTGNITCSTNTKYYYKYMQGAVVGDSGEVNVDKIDKENPTINTNLTGVVSGVNENDIDLSIGVTDTLSGYSKVVFKHKLSSDEDYSFDYKTEVKSGATMNGSQKGATTATTVTGKIERLGTGTYNVCADVYDVAGNCVSSNELTIEIVVFYPANAPEIRAGMVPVRYNTTTSNWVVCSTANTNNEWYEYKDTTSNANSSKWANVMLMDGLTVYNDENLDPDNTTVVTNDNLSEMTNKTVANMGSMFVWIPRYEYKINNTALGKTPGPLMAGTIDVNFVSETSISNSTNYIIHPAFTANINNGGWSSELPGMWVAKFEASNSTRTGEYDKTDINIRVVPSVTSWKGIKIGNIYTVCRNMTGSSASTYGFTLDIDQGGSGTNYAHLMKNSEWGAIAYLAHSRYGRNGNPVSVYKNKYSTGTISNTAQSSTGNESGIYDMSGGLCEYMAAFCNKDDNERYTETGWTAATKLTKDSDSNKYATRYTTNDTQIASSENCIVGDATYEIKVQEGEAWYNAIVSSVGKSNPFFIRGGENNNLFFAMGHSGLAISSFGFRPVIIVE